MKSFGPIAVIVLLVTVAITAFATVMAFAADAIVVTGTPVDLTPYEQIKSVLIDAVMGVGAVIIAYLANQVRVLLGEKIANQVRIYMNQVFENVVVTNMGRVKNAQTAATNETVKNEVIDKSAAAIIAKIPDALTKFNIPLNPNNPALRDKVEAEITKVLLESDPQKTLAAPDPHGPEANARDLDAPYVPPPVKKD